MKRLILFFIFTFSVFLLQAATATYSFKIASDIDKYKNPVYDKVYYENGEAFFYLIIKDTKPKEYNRFKITVHHLDNENGKPNDKHWVEKLVYYYNKGKGPEIRVKMLLHNIGDFKVSVDGYNINQKVRDFGTQKMEVLHIEDRVNATVSVASSYNKSTKKAKQGDIKLKNGKARFYIVVKDENPMAIAAFKVILYHKVNGSWEKVGRNKYFSVEPKQTEYAVEIEVKEKGEYKFYLTRNTFMGVYVDVGLNVDDGENELTVK